MIDKTEKYLPLFTLYLHAILEREVDRGYLIGKNGERLRIGVLTSTHTDPSNEFVYDSMMEYYDIVFVIYTQDKSVWGYRIDENIRVGGIITKDVFFRTNINVSTLNDI
jgi:hypothetical protein